MPERPLAIRLDDATIARLDGIAEAMSARAAGVRVSRSSAIRAAIDRGIGALEAELGVTRTRKPKAK